MALNEYREKTRMSPSEPRSSQDHDMFRVSGDSLIPVIVFTNIGFSCH